jgi:hypothetical protein
MNRILALVTVLFCMSTGVLHAAFEPLPPDPRAAAMAGAMTAVKEGAFTPFYNPAAAASSTELTPALGLSLNRLYGKSDLQTGAIGLTLPRLPFDSSGALGGGVKRYGGDGYHETSATIGYARRFGKMVQGGLSVTGYSMDTEGYAGSSATGINMGLMAEPIAGLTLGVSAFNINNATIGKQSGKLPSPLFFGASYSLTPSVLLTATVESDRQSTARLLTGSELHVMKALWLRTGLATNPSVISAGAGFGTRRLRADVAVSRHSDLGTSTWGGVEVDF